MNHVQQFNQNYTVHLKGVIPRDFAEEWVQEFFQRTGIDETDPSEFPDTQFSERTRSIPMKQLSPRTWEVVCELLGGEDQVDERTQNFSNNFNLNFNLRADEPWRGPSADSPGWHKDGWFFRHFLDSPEQALLVLVLWRDILPKSGGTFYAPDSVPLVAKELLAHPEGVHHTHPFADLIHQCKDFREMRGQAGDVVILHPFMLHTASANPSGRIRIMNNKVVSLKQPLRLDRPDGEYTPLERTLLNALRVKSLPFHITRERRRTEDFGPLSEEQDPSTP